jgi:ribosomal-protein-alanine N-acetyltransferase
MTPCLRSARLILVPYSSTLVTQEHVDWLYDADLMQYSENRHRTHTVRTQESFTGGHYGGLHPGLWLIRCNGKDIGSISAHVDSDNNHANLGILLGSREHQGQGFAAEAWCAVIDWLFESGVHKVECGTREDNHRMRRLAVTTGFTQEAEVPGHFKVGDTYKDLILYGRFKAEAFVSEWDRMWKEPFWKV